MMVSLVGENRCPRDEALFDRVSSRLSIARVMRNLLLKDVARRAGCSASMLSRIEKRETLPTVPMLVRITTALDVSMAWVLDEGEDLLPIVYRFGGEFAPAKGGQKGRTPAEGAVTSDRLPIAVRLLAAKGAVDLGSLAHHSDEATFAINRGVLQVHRGDASVWAPEGHSFHLRMSDAYSFSNGSEADLALTVLSRPASPRKIWLKAA